MLGRKGLLPALVRLSMARPVAPSATAPVGPDPPAVPMKACPIATTLGTMGRKWAITIVRDVAYFPDASFSLILRNNPGLRQRTLSLRLRQLKAEGIIERSPKAPGSRRSAYRLTPKGLELWPVLATLVQFGVHNHADVVFEDGIARNIEDVFPTSTALMLGRFAAARNGSERSPGTPS